MAFGFREAAFGLPATNIHPFCPQITQIDLRNLSNLRNLWCVICGERSRLVGLDPCGILPPVKRQLNTGIIQHDCQQTRDFAACTPFAPGFSNQNTATVRGIALVHGIEISNGHEDNSVLIVNDEPDQLRLMGTLLHKAGYSVLTAEDGSQGLALARRERPDLVISDVSMPNMNGLEFCRSIRADSELKTVPILLVSALQKDTDSVVAGLQAGADDYLEIPFDSTRLIAKVSRLLERSQLEASYRDLVEQASDMIFTQDLGGKLTSMNLAGQKFLGRKPEELIGTSFFSVFGIIPGSNGFTTALNRPQEAHEFRHQFVARSASGEDRWLDLIVSPIKDKTEETVGFRGLARDITERKHFEEALRDSEERYRLLFESTPQPIWVYNEETLAFLAVNEAATRTYGFTRDEFLSMTVDDIRAREEDIPTLMIRTGDDLVISSPWRHRTKDGKTIYVEMSSHPVVFDGKNSRLVIVNDVTERKLLDEKQQRLHTSLQQSAMEWRQTFNAIDFPVLIVDLAGTIKRSNFAAEQIVGIGAEKIVDTTIAQLGESQPWKKAAELIEKIRITQAPVAEDVRAVVRWLRDNEDVDDDRIAVVGHSEGAWVALRAAEREDRIRAMALIEAGATVGQELVLEQQRRALEGTKTSAEAQKENLMEAIQAGVNNYIVKPFTAEAMQDKINKIFK